VLKVQLSPNKPTCNLFRCYPLPSNRHYRSNDDCLERKKKNYQICSVQYCVQQLCTVQCTHTWTYAYDLTVVHWSGLAFSVVILCVTVYLCSILLFGIILCYSLFVYVCFYCVRFGFFSIRQEIG